jgi:tRNA dimethylallyltransferase
MARTLVAVIGPTASGKSALAIRLAERLAGEVVSCDSTAVFRGFDIGTDKVPLAERRGIPHHLIDIVDPTAEYTAADYARDAASAIEGIRARGRLPVVAGGTGFYYRALTRGLFPGPGRHPRLRSRLDALVARRGSDRLHRLLARIDPASAVRIRPRDGVRIVGAHEVLISTRRTLTARFAETRTPLSGWSVLGIALRPQWSDLVARVTARVDRQFSRGIIDEVRALLASGVPPSARPFTGYVYRHVLDVVRGVATEAQARTLIVRDNRRYARRQLIWFRKEPNLVWIPRSGEQDDTLVAALRLVEARLESRPDG